ncbi:MAG: hypothetical protein ABSC65_18955 [Acidobacteriaceae bacterium]|jgi:hypothetical protein
MPYIRCILFSMRALIASALLLSAPLALGSQNPLTHANVPDRPSQASSTSQLKKAADEAHDAGHIAEEIDYRQQFSRAKWATFSLDPSSLDEYDRFNLVDLNDLPLGLLLEGSHRFAEAEQILRHNQAELSSERIAGDDIKAQNELRLAHLLAREGNHREADDICSHWKRRMRRLVWRQDSAHIYGTPKAPVYDTPDVEVARWDLACGNPNEGLRLIAEQIAAHPHMLASFIVLENYYDAQGEFQMARKAESDGTLAVRGQ